MNIMTRYICKTVLQTSFIVVVALMSMDFFIQLIGEFGDIGDGNYTITQALLYVVLLMPRDLYNLFPIAGLIGCLLGLGLLASHSELIVMRAAGVSVFRISRAVLCAILLMVGFITAMGEYVAPKAAHIAENLKAIDKSAGQAVATQQGVWLKDATSFIHIKKVVNSAHLEDISRYTFNDAHQLTRVAYARQADYINSAWRVADIHETDFNGQHVTTTHQEVANWHMSLSPSLLRMAQVEPFEMDIVKLYQYNRYQKQNGLQYQASALNFWQRLLQPLGTCVMMFLAIPFIFGPLRTVTMGLRLVAGVLVGFSFYILNQFFGPFSLVYHVPPLLAAILPSILFAGIGWFLMRKVK